MSLKPFTHKGLLEIIYNFTPNWFTLNMGTGIAFLTLFNIRADLFTGELLFGQILWLVDMFFFILFSFLFISRIILYPQTLKLMLNHPIQSMFIGAIPMAMVPVLEGFIFFGPEFFGHQAIHFALVLWWIDVFLSVASGWLIPYLMFTSHKNHSLESMTAVWLLPIVASEVAATAGGIIAPYYSGATAESIIIISYILWAFSVPLAFGILVILFLRLVSHKLPNKALAVTSWLTLGPLGTGALGLLLLGGATKATYTSVYLSNISDFLSSFGFIVGLLLWGYGMWWYVMAWIITIRFFKQGLPFNMGWWGFTFPVGVFTAATFQLWRVTNYTTFEILGLLFSLQLIVFWIFTFIKTFKGMWSGYLFSAPCLSPETGLPKPEEECEKFAKKKEL
jgi:C4-dicarboxylate transporter/malic acid transport protein